MYEREYFFIQPPASSPRVPFLNPDLNTSRRNYSFEALPLGQAPLTFQNANSAENRLRGIRSATTDVLFDGTDLVVRDKIRKRLLDYEIPHLHVYPAIFIDDADKWHEDFWFLTFTERWDCWDRATSDYEQEAPPMQLGGVAYFQVYRYSFDQALMDKTPLSERLLFKLGGTLDAHIVAHESIVGKVFGSSGDNGAEYIRVSDF